MELPKRKNPRLQGYDYSSPGAYFVTICTEGKKHLLSSVNAVGADVLDGPKLELSPYGTIVDKYINQLNAHYTNISVDNYVIMPNHIHLLLTVTDSGASGTTPPTSHRTSVPRFVSALKRFSNKECGKNLWQRSYNDHIIRNREDYKEHYTYISENPLRWNTDELA